MAYDCTQSPRLLAGEQALPIISSKSSFTLAKAPEKVQQLAAMKDLSGLKRLITTSETVTYNGADVFGQVTLKLDFSGVVDVPRFIALYTHEGNYFTQLSCASSNVQINPEHLESRRCIARSLDMVEISSETRLPNQFFYSAILVTERETDYLFLSKHVIVYESRSRVGEVLRRMLALDSIEATKKGTNFLIDFFKTVLTSPESVSSILPKYFEVSPRRVEHPESIWTGFFSEFKESTDQSEVKDLQAFIEEIGRWFYLH
jgi:hypothetical protein